MKFTTVLRSYEGFHGTTDIQYLP